MERYRRDSEQLMTLTREHDNSVQFLVSGALQRIKTLLVSVRASPRCSDKYRLNDLDCLVECCDSDPFWKSVNFFQQIEQYFVVSIGQRDMIRFGCHVRRTQVQSSGPRRSLSHHPRQQGCNNVQGDKIEIGIAGKPEIQSRDFILKIVIVSA